MEAFWGITLSILVLYRFIRKGTAKPDQNELRRNTVKARWDRKRIRAENLKQQTDVAHTAESERRKRQDAEELITVVIPTIQNDGK